MNAVLAVSAGVLASAGLGGLVWARRDADLERARGTWLLVGVVTAVGLAALAAASSLLVGWPSPLFVGVTAVWPCMAAGLALGRPVSLAGIADRVLVKILVWVALLALVAAVFLVIVRGLGPAPTENGQTSLALAFVAAVVAAVATVPVRRALEERANQRVYGERHAPDEALRDFGGRMSRAVPMDELLLQLVESLKKTMHLSAAEMWTGTGGNLERSVSVPARPLTRLVLEAEELAVAARAHVQGNAWIAVWVPTLLAGREDCIVRVAAVAHLGELLGFIVVERPGDALAFVDDEDQVLADLARQVGLALHNVRLDSALQASLDELEERNQELAASRLRIVTAADESRRRIERDLHDGAQQHLVALAVKVGLAKQLMAADPETAAKFLDELREDVQATLTELRNLAHGIYPPLLRDRGLSEALRTAANRAVLPTSVNADEVARHQAEVEAAVYFCCLEAMQNAGKHAGESARLTVTVTEEPGWLRFSVADDGPGFDADAAVSGDGFVNMRDRVGAIGGTLRVTSSPGQGTTVAGDIPLPGETTPQS